jgi:hypothetical protein
MNEEEKEQLKKEILEELEKYIDNKLSKIDNDIYSIGEEIIEIENRLDKIRKILKDHDMYTDKYYWW